MNLSASILYEDNHLLVLNKPGGMPTQPSGSEQANLESYAKDWIKSTYHKPGNVFLEAVHRLDKPVSGVVVFAKTSKALARLNAAMREKEAEKVYFALVETSNPSAKKIVQSDDPILLENYLLHDDFRASIVLAKTPQAKLAQLNYSVIDVRQRRALLRISLLTGRYHQIRAQLAHIHLPILGDAKYGSITPFQDSCIALHHRHLRIPHPITQNILAFEAPLPDYWQLIGN